MEDFNEEYMYAFNRCFYPKQFIKEEQKQFAKQPILIMI